MDTFYSTVTTLCFTLIGLWWAVLQLRWHEWVNVPARRRTAHSVFLAFLVPGIMSLGAQIAPELPLMWRLVFVAGSIGGIVATFFLARAAAAGGFFLRVGRWLMLLLYVFVLVTALVPDIYRAFGLTGLQGEALWVTILVLLGVMLAWEAVMEPSQHTN